MGRRKFGLRELLNNMIWNPSERPENYVIVIECRGATNEEVRVNGSMVERVGRDGFVYVSLLGERKFIPYHRVKLVLRNGVVVWRSRKVGLR